MLKKGKLFNSLTLSPCVCNASLLTYPWLYSSSLLSVTVSLPRYRCALFVLLLLPKAHQSTSILVPISLCCLLWLQWDPVSVGTSSSYQWRIGPENILRDDMEWKRERAEVMDCLVLQCRGCPPRFRLFSVPSMLSCMLSFPEYLSGLPIGIHPLKT